jgi:hypothetical protein
MVANHILKQRQGHALAEGFYTVADEKEELGMPAGWHKSSYSRGVNADKSLKFRLVGKGEYW